MEDEVFDALEQVVSFKTFLAFMAVLENNYLSSGSTWENQTIDRYIEASAAWASDTLEVDPTSDITTPTWRNFAEILASGIVYE